MGGSQLAVLLQVLPKLQLLVLLWGLGVTDGIHTLFSVCCLSSLETTLPSSLSTRKEKGKKENLQRTSRLRR